MKNLLLCVSLSLALLSCGKEDAVKSNELYAGHWTGQDNEYLYDLIIPEKAGAEGEWKRDKKGSNAGLSRKGPVRVNDTKLFVASKSFSIDKEIYLDGNFWRMELEKVVYSRPASNQTYGEYTFWIKTDLGGGPIRVFIDDEQVGTIYNYFQSGVACGNGDVNVSRASGNYMFKAENDRGDKWNANIEFKAGICELYEIK
jgi:hypothetical protein